MRATRALLAATALAAAVVPTAASAGNQCDLKPHQQQVGPLTVTTYDLVC